MDIILTLTNVGADQGVLFDLYSDTDGFTTPFETDVALATLQAGYTTSSTPVGTLIVRVCGQNVKCTDCIDITLVYTTTTSTTLTPVGCEETAESGASGVTEYQIPLEVEGGELVIDFQAYGVPDKLEILHRGVKYSTSGMTVANAGPFDDIYGDPTVPSNAQALAIDQFIGTQKSIPPTREAEILADLGVGYLTNKQQLIWWVYTASNVIDHPFATVRITGPSGTAWAITRLCTPEIATTDVIFNTNDSPSLLKQYNPSTMVSTDLIPVDNPGVDVAHTFNKLWVYGTVAATEIDEYDITLSPFTAVFNRTITNIYLSAGLCAIDDSIDGLSDTIITLDSADVYEADITTAVAVNTLKFSIIAGRVCTGDFVYTTGGKFIILNDDGGGNYFISQFDYATGVLEFDLDITSTTTTAYGLFEYSGVIYIASGIGGTTSSIHSIGLSTPYTMTLVDTLAYAINGASQIPSQITQEFVFNVTTTTTTTIPTTTTTTTLTGLELGSISALSNTTSGCSETIDTIVWIDTQTPLTLTPGDVIYGDIGGTVPFVGDGNYYKVDISGGANNMSARVNLIGVVLSPVSLCP